MQRGNDQGKATRDDRLKAALRENLRRRKAQARERRDGASGAAVPPAVEDESERER